MRLTKPQKLIYEMDKFSGGVISVICGSMLIKGSKSVKELSYAVNELYRLNDATRIRIIENDGEPQQLVTEYIEKEIDVLKFSSKEDL